MRHAEERGQGKEPKSTNLIAERRGSIRRYMKIYRDLMGKEEKEEKG